MTRQEYIHMTEEDFTLVCSVGLPREDIGPRFAELVKNQPNTQPDPGSIEQMLKQEFAGEGYWGIRVTHPACRRD